MSLLKYNLKYYVYVYTVIWRLDPVLTFDFFKGFMIICKLKTTNVFFKYKCI